MFHLNLRSTSGGSLILRLFVAFLWACLSTAAGADPEPRNGTRVTTLSDGVVVRSALYDPGGRLLALQDGRGETRFGYDAAGVLQYAIHPDGRIVTVAHGYHDDGRLAAISRSDGTGTVFEYDSLGRWQASRFSNGDTETVEYREDGGYSVTLKPRTGLPVRYDHAASGRLLRALDPFGGETVYAYDDEGRLVSETFPDGQAMAYSYAEEALAPEPDSADSGAVPMSGELQHTAQLPAVVVNGQRCDSSPMDENGWCSAYNQMTLHAELLAMGYLPRIGGYVLGGSVAAKRVIDILKPGGKLIGSVKKGASNNIRTVSQQKFAKLKAELLKGATPTAKYAQGNGTWYELPGGGRIGVRISAKNGETLDIDVPGLPNGLKVHQR